MMVHIVSDAFIKHPKENSKGLIVEAFLDGVLSFEQCVIRVRPRKGEFVIEYHSNLDSGYEIRIEASVRLIPKKYWREFVLPGLLEYAKQWDCLMEDVQFSEGGKHYIKYYLHLKPFQYKVSSRS